MTGSAGISCYTGMLANRHLFCLLIFTFLSTSRIDREELRSVFGGPACGALFGMTLSTDVARKSVSAHLTGMGLSFFRGTFRLLCGHLSRLCARGRLRTGGVIHVSDSVITRAYGGLGGKFAINGGTSGGTRHGRVGCAMTCSNFSTGLTRMFSGPRCLDRSVTVPTIMRRLVGCSPRRGGLCILSEKFYTLGGCRVMRSTGTGFMKQVGAGHGVRIVRDLVARGAGASFKGLRLISSLMIFLCSERGGSFSGAGCEIVGTGFGAPHSAAHPGGGNGMGHMRGRIFFVAGSFSVAPRRVTFYCGGH